MQQSGRVAHPGATFHEPLDAAAWRAIKNDPKRPSGVTPEQWAAEMEKRNTKPAVVRQCDRQKWAPCSQLIDVPVPLNPVDIACAADAAITRMLSGKLPRGAGSNTAAVSAALCAMHSLGDDPPDAIFIAMPRLRAPFPAVPFRSSLHELRRARGRRI